MEDNRPIITKEYLDKEWERLKNNREILVFPNLESYQNIQEKILESYPNLIEK